MRLPLILPLLFITNIALASGRVLVPTTEPIGATFVTATPSGYLLGWLQGGPQLHIMAARLGRDATSFDGPGIALAPTSIGFGALPHLAIATAGSKSLLTWIDSYPDPGVHAVIFNDANPPFLTPQPFVVSRNVATFPYKIPDPVVTAAWNGHEFLVVWTTYDVIYETFVGLDGSVRGEQKLYTGGANATDLRLIFDGERFVLAWNPIGCWGCTQSDVIATRLSADGALLEEPRTIATDSYLLDAASAHPGEALAIVYNKQGDNGILLSTNGPLSAGAPFTILDWKGGADAAVTVDGDRYLVALAYYRDSYKPLATTWLALTHVDRDGTVERRTITTTPELYSPGIAVMPSGPVLITASQANPVGYFPSDLAFVTPPVPPRNARLTMSSDSAFVTWDDTSDNEDGFGITACWRSDCTTYDFAPNTTSALVPPAADTYSIASFNGAGESESIPVMSAGNARRHVTK